MGRFKSDNGGSTAEPATGLALKVVVMKARNLAAKDRNGMSDPYLVLRLGDARAVTHAVPKTLNPEWNIIEQLPINGINSLVLDVICWDKDRFGKDYLGEFDLALEEIFQNEKNAQEAKWYPLRSKRPGKKTSIVSGEVMLQFTLLDIANPASPHPQTMERLQSLIRSVPVASTGSAGVTPAAVTPQRADPLGEFVEDDDEEGSDFEEDSNDEGEGEGEDEGEDASKPETAEKRRRRLRIRGLKRKNRRSAYAFTNGDSDVVGIIYLEICRVTDLPPEHNLTRTSFDMDPFVVASLGRKTYRTRRVRHNLNPVFNEKMIFQLLNHEKSYSFSFTVIDHDKYSGNDFIASCTLPVQDLLKKAPQADPTTGLYEVREPQEPREATPLPHKSRLQRMGLSRSSSSQSLNKKSNKAASVTSAPSQAPSLEASQSTSNPSLLAPPETQFTSLTELETNGEDDDPEFHEFSVPLTLKNIEKWEAKHSPVVYLRAKYVPYPALRQQFWRAMLRQYDTDESGRISRIELTTMLDTLGSTLKDSTIDSFFQRFPHKAADNEESWDLTFDEVVICLEDQLEAKSRPESSVVDKVKFLTVGGNADQGGANSGSSTPSDGGQDFTEKEDSGDEHVVEIRECPICHQPRLNKRNDTDIVTHIATCASQDWRQVKTVLMGGFVTASQAQRKWYSKVITKISYGGYKLGANSANILVQDRLTGQINEEKMSVYVRLGIRMLYKGLKSRDMENKQIRKMLKNLSIKQGKKFDDPASKDEIEKFIHFHRLNMDEVLLPLDQFQNFNEFFYRALKPGARPCSAPNNPAIIVSPADCRSVVFNHLTQATKIWVKGREFSMKRLLGDAYPDDVARFENGALGIFRLAPQDYHRFHIPVDGVMGEPKTIAGEYYTVNPMAIRSALDVYGENVRVVVPIDSEVHGRVMVICVGAMMVGSTVITRTAGERVQRAEELGYFKFGGSTILLLFEPGKMRFDSDLTENASGALETLIRVGMSVGHSPDEPQWADDMRVSEENITEEQKKDAKRRIQGSMAQDSPSDSNDDDGLHNLPPTMNTMAASAL
ncbi:Phosphatidylserine decarboxylase [Cordyceps fumosorosea ARSEF 2679]|uniref:Phosphatidylserine decarboxylase proenzyme 2 n=1 Tax=Cordyceps fumosorosea (strain ARSEF 2679) TaxID=1081104 RepID=A0A167JT87_CORFA|nr:Phosphatidylserine decarboxylase [Cordyceps fumosorosea ARSEF 2679]OAA50721.1 Phosphatidylserine decarboxylase [Cordyceps fumosorosea ARSEF 2679]